MLQDIAPSLYQVAYAPRPPREGSPCFLFRGREILEREAEGQLTLPTWGELAHAVEAPQWLFRIDETDYYLAAEGGAAPLTAGYGWVNLRESRGKKSRLLRFAESTAYHLALWYRDYRFCGRCGGETQPDDRERMLRCPRCGNLIYPKIAPAVIVAITRGDSILLARSVRSTFRHHSLISGYVEVGETLEHAVRREVMEEVGLRLGALRYLGDQPWGVSGSQMFAFQAEAQEGDIRLQESELCEAGWFRRDELEPRGRTVSIALELIERFRTGTL